MQEKRRFEKTRKILFVQEWQTFSRIYSEWSILLFSVHK
jgi:hypothetical protein